MRRPLIKAFIKPYTAYEPMEDLLQEAYFGLWEAVHHYEAAEAERAAKNSEIKKLESAGKIDEVALELSRATQMFDDQFRMGDNYIFIRSGRFIMYEDISKIYQYVHLTNNVEDRRELRINNTKGRKSVLCKLALRSQDDKKVKNVCAAVLEKIQMYRSGTNNTGQCSSYQ